MLFPSFLIVKFSVAFGEDLQKKKEKTQPTILIH